MEKSLDNFIEETMNSAGVVGALCVDKQGLCLGARGCAVKQCAGSVQSIAQQAAMLCASSTETPVVVLESESGNMLIKSHKDVTVAVYKSPC